MSTSPQKSENKPPRFPSNDDDLQKVADIKEYLETRISDLELELEKLRNMLLFVDSTLREKSFVPAIALRNASATTASIKAPPVQRNLPNENGLQASSSRATSENPTEANNPNQRQLRRTKDSALLATAFIDPQKVVIVPAKEMKLTQRTPPFESFFVNRILRGFQSKDQEEVKSGKLKANEVLQYNVVEAEGNISSVTISNYRESARLNEILSTATWAFTRMLEKK